MTGTDTIFALASGQSPAGIAVFRVSGPAAAAALHALTGTAPAVPRQLRRARLLDPATGDVIDEALAAWFPAPGSFTGEDVVELHVHGGRAVIEALAEVLGHLPGLRLAAPGEFTRRAFENGKMDLTRAEALADLVAAETEAQRLQALGQLGGALAERLEAWRAHLVELLAEVEAAVDFADEDIPPDLLSRVIPKILGLKDELAHYIDDRYRGERLRDGLTVAILGAPNVGKSSLLNRLARREAAIVSETEGTTRDVIEVHLDLGGLPVILLDMAGLRATSDAVEAEGVRRAEARARDADLRLAVFDAARWPARDAATSAHLESETICVLNKSDLINANNFKGIDIETPSGEVLAPCLVSARTGAGLDDLLARLEAALRRCLGDGAGTAPLTRVRHRRALEDAVAALGRIHPELAPELLAEELRLAARALGRITGEVDVEDVLDRIFARFCIGK